MKNVSERELWNAVLALHDKLARNKEEILGEYLSHWPTNNTQKRGRVDSSPLESVEKRATL